LLRCDIGWEQALAPQDGAEGMRGAASLAGSVLFIFTCRVGDFAMALATIGWQVGATLVALKVALAKRSDCLRGLMSEHRARSMPC